MVEETIKTIKETENEADEIHTFITFVVNCMSL